MFHIFTVIKISDLICVSCAVHFCYRQHDYENFLCTLLLPSHSRTSAFAIRAFNIEVAKVQDQVSDPHIGQMRMKFWEETVDKIYVDHAPSHPVAVELHHVSTQGSSALIYNLIILKNRYQFLILITWCNIYIFRSSHNT